jgi:transcriptional regulator with XRE-family HTH domain
LGVTEVTLWNWERGATSPPIAKAQRMADLYRIPLDEIQFYRG